MNLFKWALIFLFFSSCTRKNEGQEKMVFEINEIAVEQQIPKVLLQQLDEELKEDFKSSSPLYSFLPLQVGFKSDQRQVLKKSHMIFSFPKGGGEIDLRDVVSGEGSFYLYLPSEQFSNEMEMLHFYYVSNAPQKQIGTEKYGLGCGKWSDLKDQFQKLQKPDFLKLNTTDLRYLRVIAGTYVLIFRQNRNVYLTQLTVGDSRYQDELCQQGGKSES